MRLRLKSTIWEAAGLLSTLEAPRFLGFASEAKGKISSTDKNKDIQTFEPEIHKHTGHKVFECTPTIRHPNPANAVPDYLMLNAAIGKIHLRS